MPYYIEMMIRRAVFVASVVGWLAWMAWDSYVMYQILLAVSK